MGVLIEKMRREGFEMAITPPKVMIKQDPNNPDKKLEPYEEVIIDTDLDYAPMIIDKLNDRKGVLLNMEEQNDGRQLLMFKVPTRGMLGFRNILINETRGTAQLRSQFLEFDEYAGDIKKVTKGAII